jgi:hypothetical protein
MPASEGPLGQNTLGLKFEDTTAGTQVPYQKTYQSYILNKDNDGHLYMMVVGSENSNSSTAYPPYSHYFDENSVTDTVDLFPLPNRPLTNRKNT